MLPKEYVISKETKNKISIALTGIKRSAETKRKMSESKLGNKYCLGHKKSKEAKQKIGLSKIGNSNTKGQKRSKEQILKMKIAKQNMSEETKRKMSESQKNMSEETRLKHRLSNLGHKCNFWKGGITPKTKLRLNIKEWKRTAKLIRNRDNYICQNCGIRETKLDVHHKIPFYLTQDNSSENLITLCKSCHQKAEQEFNQNISFLNHLSDFARSSAFLSVPSSLSQ